MDKALIQIVACCTIFSVLAVCLAVYVNNSVYKIFPGFEKNIDSLGTDLGIFVFENSVPRYVQCLYFISRIVFLLATACGLLSAWYFDSHEWIKIFLVPTAYAVYEFVVCVHRFVKYKGRQA